MHCGGTDGRRWKVWSATALVLALAAVDAPRGESIEKKWRLSGALGGYNARDEVNSNAANFLLVYDREAFETGEGNVIFARYRDPRNDSAAFGALDVNASSLTTVALQFAPTKVFVIEGSLGYQKADIGNIEVSAEFFGAQPLIDNVDFAFQTYHVNAGELERVPLQLTTLARFRPRASFNPYLGIGIGYSIIGFEPSSDLNRLSTLIDGSTGQDCAVSDDFFTPNATQSCTGTARGLEGARVEARDSFEWNLAVGAEINLKKKWSAFLDVRWVDASRDILVGFDGGLELGRSVPQFTDFNTSPIAMQSYGAVQIASGGLWDGGIAAFVPDESIPLDSTGDADMDGEFDCVDPLNPLCFDFCAVNFTQCEVKFFDSPGTGRTLVDISTGQTFVDDEPGVGDGRNDPGRYYVQGGRFSYDGIALQLGLRYTF